MKNHFNFKRLEKENILITNDFGRYAFLKNEEFKAFLLNRVDAESELFKRLKQGFFLIEPMEMYSNGVMHDLRQMKNYVFQATALHIFVVTNACNLSCVYCQAKDKAHRSFGYMTEEIAYRAVDIALESPARKLNFEFQGGEPLLNFSIIQKIIEYTEERRGEKEVQYTIVSNFSLLTEEILDYLLNHDVSICTSLDGPQFLHDCNRPFASGGSSYEQANRGISLLKKRGCNVSAIQTTTRHSLLYARQIVEEYGQLKTPGIFLRPLTPLGFAKNDWEQIGYEPEEFLIFYREAFDEILKINREGVYFPELHASYFLRKILQNNPYNYMELRSPCGASVGQMAYYYDGQIYTCDEARMVGEAGDHAFCLGNVFENDYDSLMNCNVCKATCAASIVESVPGCCDCVYQPYCGICPVVSYAIDGDIFSKRYRNYRCKIYSGILDFLFELIRDDNTEIINILRSWIE